MIVIKVGSKSKSDCPFLHNNFATTILLQHCLPNAEKNTFDNCEVKKKIGKEAKKIENFSYKATFCDKICYLSY